MWWVSDSTIASQRETFDFVGFMWNSNWIHKLYDNGNLYIICAAVGREKMWKKYLRNCKCSLYWLSHPWHSPRLRMSKTNKRTHTAKLSVLYAKSSIWSPIRFSSENFHAPSAIGLQAIVSSQALATSICSPEELGEWH